MKYVNLTAHTINLLPYGIVIPHSDSPAKVTINKKLISKPNEIPLYKIEYPDIAGLPKEREGVRYIVSAPVLNYVLEHLPERKDVVATLGAIKDKYGKTVGCSAFRVNG